MPESLEFFFLIEWFIIRPTEIVLAAALKMDQAVEELRFKLYPGVYRKFESDTFAKILKRDTELYLGQEIGLADYRDIQTVAVRYHNDPDEYKGMSLGIADLQRGHTSGTADGWYGTSSDLPQGIRMDKMKGFHRASCWWWHITGKWLPYLLRHTH